MRWLGGLALGFSIGAGAPADAQTPTPEELSRAFTEKFLGGAGSSSPLIPTPAPAPGPSSPGPARGAPAAPPTFLGVPATPAPAAAAPVSPAGQPPQFVLAGVVMVGESGMALLQEPGQPGPRFVQVGESVGVYRLTAVRPDRAILTGPAGEIAVPLGASAATGSPAPWPTRRGQPVALPADPAATPPAVQESPRPNQERKQQRRLDREQRRGEAQARRGRGGGSAAPQPGSSPPAGDESE